MSFADELEAQSEAKRWKDYDAVEAEHPSFLTSKYGSESWRVFLAEQDSCLLGGAILAANSPNLDFLDGPEVAGIMDLRVHPDFRNAGVGRRLIDEMLEWAREQGIVRIKVETQDVNVAACRLYKSAGFRVKEINPNAYPPELGESRVIWELSLSDWRAPSE